jgi:hypothetical protein
MNANGTITMTMREIDRFKVIEAVAGHRLKPGQAAERLALSVRQVERLVLRYLEHGPAGVASGRRGRPGNRKLDEGLALRALTLIRERYADFGPALGRREAARVPLDYAGQRDGEQAACFGWMGTGVLA